MKISHKIMVVLAGALLLIVLGVIISLWTFRQIEEAAAVRSHTDTLLNGANSLLLELVDAESGQRGFVLTGDKAFLEPYSAVHNRISGYLEKLRQMTLVSAAQDHLNTVAPLLDAKLAQMAQTIDARRNHGVPASVAMVHNGLGRHLMDEIRSELKAYSNIEEDVLTQREAAFEASMRQLFSLIVAAIMAALLFAAAFVFLLYRESKQRIQNLVHIETRHLLELQEELNLKLQQTNLTLQMSEEKLAVTLNSIGDAVIATDAEARISLMNPLAERLTGWTRSEAMGRSINDIFHIIKQESRQPALVPLMNSLLHGTKQALTNHTLLISRDGSERAISDCCAPIRDRDDHIVGAVLVFSDVTEEYAIQKALRDQQFYTRSLIESNVDALMTTDPSGIITDVNQQMSELTGFTREKLIGTPFKNYFTDAVRAEAGIERVLNEHKVSNYELIARAKDGSETIVSYNASTFYDRSGVLQGVFAAARDMTEQKLLDKYLRDQQFYTRSLIESNVDALITTDPSGIITDANEEMAELTGGARSDITGTPFKNYFTDSERADAGIMRVLREHKVADYELTAIHKSGKRTVVSCNAATFRDRDGKLQGVFASLHNITERKRMDQALQDKNIELERAKVVAEQANLAKSAFLSKMSHELRTPLNAILGFAQLLETGSPPPTAVQVVRLQQIVNAGWYLLELINEILDLALIEAGKLSLSREPVSLGDVMLECRIMVESQAKQHGITLTFPKFDTPCFVSADRTRLKQILINLLTNAIKYNRAQGMVEVKCSAISTERIRISVKDTGAGLTQEKLAQLFQPFNRLGQENGAEEGTGIGLIVAKQLAELMGGSMGVKSSPGVGSEFWIELNGAVKPKLAGEKHAENSDQDLGSTNLRTLLYVEDNPANLMLVEQIISEHPQVRMLSARDGNLGVALARTHLPDVILMDINLPGISGFEAMTILRNDPATKHIPVVALSANAMLRDIEKGLDAGFFRYLTKPIKVNEFMIALDDALQFSKIELIDTPETDKYYD